MKKCTMSIIVTLFMLLTGPVTGGTHLSQQTSDGKAFITAVRAALLTEEGSPGDPGDFQYTVLYTFQMTETERALLEREKTDPKLIRQMSIAAQVAVWKPDGLVWGVYHVQPSPSGELTARRVVRLKEGELLFDELLKIRKIADRISHELGPMTDISRVLLKLFPPQFFR